MRRTATAPTIVTPPSSPATPTQGCSTGSRADAAGKEVGWTPADEASLGLMA